MTVTERSLALDRARPGGTIARGHQSAAGRPWILAFDASIADPATRSDIASGLISARVSRFGWLVLQTCRRVELMGAGPRPSPDMLAGLTGVDAASRACELVGEDAAGHLLRLAAGLESAVVGEDQVLGQLRRLRRSAEGTPIVDGRLVGLLDTAIRLGRQARAEQPRAERSLADRALAWLESRVGTLDGARLLVVGSGPIGHEASRLADRAGARVSIASRSPGASGRLTLAMGARSLSSVDAAVVALAGPWSDLLDAPLGARSGYPFTVDLSAPSAIPGPLRARLGSRLATLDDLSSAGTRADAVTTGYVRHAEALVDRALEDIARRSDAEPGAAIRDLRDEVDARRRRELEELLSRLPDLDAKERAAIERFSRRLVAGIIHAPTLALRGQAR